MKFSYFIKNKKNFEKRRVYSIIPIGDREECRKMGVVEIQNVVVVEEALTQSVNDETAEDLGPHDAGEDNLTL